jgi:putative ubiquitin-RnfH superfamily antitoxin RatB of RatAB toxin-antitoxin module
MHVEVVYALPDHQHRVHLELHEGATVAVALDAVRRFAPFDTLDLERADVGIYGTLVDGQRRLLPGDRVEIYRKLLVDPKEARRRRAQSER